jgi:diguanylate cyclase (GGDEF)-like protein/PAS domain S-box-containing protein
MWPCWIIASSLQTSQVKSEGAPTEVQLPGEQVASMRRSKSRQPWWFLCLVVLAGMSAAHLFVPGTTLDQATYMPITVGAGAAACIGARRQPAFWRFPWWFIATGVMLSGIGDIVFYVVGLVGGPLTDVSLADAFWLASYIALAVGLSSIVVGGHGERRLDIDGLIDIGSFAVVAAIVVTQFTVVRDVMSDTSFAMSTRLIWTTYPVLDAALLAVAVQAVVGRRLRGRGGVLLILGVTMWLISDFALLLVNDAAGVVRWLDIGWMVGAASLAASAWPPDTADLRGEQALPMARVTDARIFITLLPLLVPGVIEVWGISRGSAPNAVLLLAATVALVALASARSTRLVKARNRQEAALERSTRYYAALAENSSDAVIVVDAYGHVLNDAPNLISMLGRTGETTKGMDVIGLLRPFDQAVARSVLERWWSATGVVADAEIQATRACGSDRWFGVRATNLSDDPDVAGLVINLRDITDRKRAEQELNHNAFHDSLTGLANRALFNDRLEHALERTARNDLGVAVVYLDLDGFKMVNDSRGHEAGDQVLREVAARLNSAVRTADTVSRLGGDEFAILTIESPRALDEAETIAERVLQTLLAPFVFADQQIMLSASIGIAIGDISCTASTMMRDADVAMYKAKTTGKAKWALYDPAMRTAALERLDLDSDLRQALARKQLRLVYQPFIELESNKLVGFEALLRWDHPTRGEVEPLVFIPIAESNGAITAIGQWVLEEACRTAARWQHAYPEAGLTMAVNLSARQIATPDIVDHVAKALEETGFAPASLILEITESILVEDADIAATRLHQMHALGVRLAIDDFGTGYSSLSYLRQFPIDILKIDKSFTDTITDRAQIPPIVRGLIDLAKTLRIQTVAEGIELDVQRETLRDQQCEFGQGFLFARPLEIDDAANLLAQLNSADPTTVGSRSSAVVPGLRQRIQAGFSGRDWPGSSSSPAGIAVAPARRARAEVAR